jgi:hypothetical protein
VDSESFHPRYRCQEMRNRLWSVISFHLSHYRIWIFDLYPNCITIDVVLVLWLAKTFGLKMVLSP